MDGGAGPMETSGIARHKRVFCNRGLRMTNISHVGFDMDYTLAIYDQARMDRLSIEATREKLLARGYPEIDLDVSRALGFPVRGLLIDRKCGHVLKMDRYKVVTKGFHGFRELSKDEIHGLYQAKKIRPGTSRYHWIDTLYALSEVALYAALVDAYERAGYPIDYARVFADIRECIDEAHRDGTILDAVGADLPHYVPRDPGLAPTLHKLRSAGKKLFLLTNSRWTYTDKMMSYLLGDALGEYPTWRNYFDVIVVAATKPAFFAERRPLLERDGDAVRRASGAFDRGKVYEGGNLPDLERLLGVQGDQVLYVGDHIYGDILRSKKDSAWRTAMIIQELETELTASAECKGDFDRAATIEEARWRLEDDLRYYQARFKEVARHQEQLARGEASRTNGTSLYALEEARMQSKRAVDRVRTLLRRIDAELGEIERRTDARFHPFWGSLLKEGSEQSSFGSQVDEYACLYTSRVSNLLGYSPQQYFRSPRDVMAHEIG